MDNPDSVPVRRVSARRVVSARRAVPEDAEELVRLRTVMLDALGRDDDPSWHPLAVRMLRERLADPRGDLAVFVVERADGALAACAAGSIEYRLPGPDNPLGAFGYVYNVATDPDLRRRGYSRACMTALLAWYRERGVRKIDLHASADAEGLYASLGFGASAGVAMRLVY